MLKFVFPNNLVLYRKTFNSIRPTICRTMSNGQDFIEGIVCKESDIPENGMKEFPLGPDGGKVLVVKQEGQFYAIGSKCTHYLAPLATGTLGKGRVRCPWHGACFNLKTGDIEDHPGLDSVACYNVSVLSNGDVKVRGKKSSLASDKRIKNMVRRNPKDKETYVIVGGGVAGSSCAEVLRQEGFTGQLIVISDENYLPYDRIKISKFLDNDISNILLRKIDFYTSNDIEVLTGETVTSLDAGGKVISTASGKQFNYQKVFIGVGVRAREPSFIEGYPMGNIFTLRKYDDAKRILELLSPEANLVVIGSSFIGMEVAAFGVNKAKSVTILGRSEVPFKEVLGGEVGQALADLYESKGVKLIMNAAVKRFEGSDNKVTAVIYNDGDSVPADVVVVGAGSQFDLKFLDGTPVKLSAEGSIDVNENMETNVDGIYAGGDIAYAPVTGTDNEKASIGHFQLAQYHARVAALNMVGKKTALKSVPFFFTLLFGHGIRYAGFSKGYDGVVTVGDVKGLKFVAYYCKGDEVVAVTSISFDPVVAKWAEYVYNGNKLYKSEAVDNKWLENYSI